MLKFLLLITGILFFEQYANAQQINAPLALRDELISFTPKEFYIAEVTDERTGNSSVATLVHKDAVHGYTSQQVNLKDGPANAINHFIKRNLKQDTSLRPVSLTIKEFKLAETSEPGGKVNGHLVAHFSFGVQKNYGIAHLVDYTGGIRYIRPDNEVNMAEPALRHVIEDALNYFNNWINEQANKNILLAKVVKVGFTDYKPLQEGDTIYYSANRPLTRADFTEKLPPGKFEAEIFTSLGYSEQIEVNKGVIHVNIVLKVDLPKNDCMVRPGSLDDYVLNHEQRHFDIEKIIAERFKQKILAMNLPVDNFDGPISIAYFEALREAASMQKQYDSETHHGIDRQAQAGWNNKIDKELQLYRVKE